MRCDSTVDAVLRHAGDMRSYMERIVEHYKSRLEAMVEENESLKNRLRQYGEIVD